MHVGGVIYDVEKPFDCINQASAFRSPCAMVECGLRSPDFKREILIYEQNMKDAKNKVMKNCCTLKKHVMNFKIRKALNIL
jgi:hypothetical protein